MGEPEPQPVAGYPAAESARSRGGAARAWAGGRSRQREGVARVSLGLIALGVVAALVYFGVAQRTLDRMRLTDTQALVFIALMILGSFLTIPLLRGRVQVTVNMGGAVIPLALCVYLLAQAGTAWERWRALLAALATGLVIWLLTRITDFGPHGGTSPILDPLWLFALLGGAIAYALGRSRRAAFVAAVLGVLIADAASIVSALRAGRLAVFPMGGGGVFDAVVVAGVFAVALAEVFGEAREALQGGPVAHRSEELEEQLRGPGGPYEQISPRTSTASDIPSEAIRETTADVGERERNQPDDGQLSGDHPVENRREDPERDDGGDGAHEGEGGQRRD